MPDESTWPWVLDKEPMEEVEPLTIELRATDRSLMIPLQWTEVSLEELHRWADNLRQEAMRPVEKLLPSGAMKGWKSFCIKCGRWHDGITCCS